MPHGTHTRASPHGLDTVDYDFGAKCVDGIVYCLNARRIWASTPQISDFHGLCGLRGFWIIYIFRAVSGVLGFTGLFFGIGSVRLSIGSTSVSRLRHSPGIGSISSET